MLLLIALNAAQASDFVDTWVTTALEESNVLAGPDAYSPAANFVQRGNSTFFENYETKYTDDISMTHLALYRRDDGFAKGVITEAAFVLRMQPYLDVASSKPGVSVSDDGSYVRIIKEFGGDQKNNLSFTGYAVDANRFRLGYSYDITWGGRDIFAFDPYAAPGVRVQYQNGGNYVFAGAKTAVGDYTDPETGLKNNEAYWGGLAGGGVELGKHFRWELGLGSFQQGQLTNVGDVDSELYNAPINAAGVSTQLSVRTNPELDYVVSNELKLYRNAPEFVKDSYLVHRQLDGFGLLVQGEANVLFHNLIDPESIESTTVERAIAGDLQALAVTGTTEMQLDFVYKDLPFIVFNIPGITSGYALDPDFEATPQLYVRGRVAHWFPTSHLTPSLGVGWMLPSTYTTGSSYFVQYDEANKAHVPDGQAPTAILSSVGGLQWDVSKSVVVVGEVLYTLDNNLSKYESDDEGNNAFVPEDSSVRNAVGFNLMMRARF
jgi:hypothetical protein